MQETDEFRLPDEKNSEGYSRAEEDTFQEYDPELKEQEVSHVNNNIILQHF